MKLNFTPFVDLFSILSIGLLLIMTMTSGTDVERREARRSVVIIRLQVGAMVGTGARIEPYLLRGNEEVSGSEVGADFQVDREADYIEIAVRGNPGPDLWVGFRVVSGVDAEVIGDDRDTQLIKIGGGGGMLACSQTMGSWRDPVACVGGDESCFRCGG